MSTKMKRLHKIAREYDLNILNPDALKALMYENAMNAIATLSKIIID